MKPVDLRSDTVTKPTPEMLQAMITAEVGDDVFGEDPTVNRFQQKIAGMFGKEAGLFVPSGVMSNQLCLRVLTQPSEEIIIDELGHIFNYETAGAALLSGIQIRPVQGVRGKLKPEHILPAIRTKNDWDPITSVICLENSTNKGGGAVYSKDELRAIRAVADEHKVAVHLDGARIWNAITASGIEPAFFGSIADTISVCFSKGLGAPMGSMMLGSAEQVKKARRFRKMWGGGTRQIGLMAAAADYAVEQHWPLMSEDHRKAKVFAQKVSEHTAYAVNPAEIETNIVIFSVKDGDALKTVAEFKEKGVLMSPFGPDKVRAVFHFQVDELAFAQVLSSLD